MFTDYLPFVSAAVMIVFTYFVFQRFFSKGRKAYHLLVWGIGLVFYTVGSFAEAFHAAVGWNALNFRLWYLAGAVLVAAWLGQGTVELLSRKKIKGIRISHIIAGILLAASLYASVRVFTARLDQAMLADEVTAVVTENGFTEEQVINAAASAVSGLALDDGAISQRKLSPLGTALLDAVKQDVNLPESVQGNTLDGLMAEVGGDTITVTSSGEALNVTINGLTAGTISLAIKGEMHGHAILTPGVRVLTPFFNVYGLFTLVGGALYSAYIFLRKRIMPNRVIGNVLIAAGALMPGIGGLLSRFGLGGYLYVGELLGAILMFAGFLAATNRPQEVENRVSDPAPAAAA